MIKWIKLFLTHKTEPYCIDAKPFIDEYRIRTIMNFDIFSNKKKRSLQRVEQLNMPYWQNLENSSRKLSEISAFRFMSQTVWVENSTNIS